MTAAIPRIAPADATRPDPRELRAALLASTEVLDFDPADVRYQPAMPGIDGRKTVNMLSIAARAYNLPHLLLDERRVLVYTGAVVGVTTIGGQIAYSYPLHAWEEPGRASGSALRVLADVKVETPHGQLLHVSMSHPRHLPSWKELKQVRALFFPLDEDVLQVLPRAEDYVNDHPFCLHLFECPEKWGLRP